MRRWPPRSRLCEALERQLKEHALEAHRVRIGLDDDIRRLTALLSLAGETQERMRREHAEAMAARDQDLRQSEERHAGQEKRMLAEVDRARQTAKALEPELAREQQRRAKSEEAAAKRLEAELEKVHRVRETARQAEAGLRDQLAVQGIELAQTRTQAEALAASVEALEGRLDDEKAAHEQTRRMLAEALISKSAAQGDVSARRRRKP
jgi:hypothetical protein